MKVAKIVLTVITILFAGLGLFKVISFNISNPIMMFSLGTLLILKSIEYRRDKDKGGFFLMLLTALFIYGITIYNTLIA